MLLLIEYKEDGWTKKGTPIKWIYAHRARTIIISVIGILLAITAAVILPGSQEKTRHTKAMNELSTIASAAQLYAAKYNDFPADSPGKIPDGLNEFIKNENNDSNWPNAPWPGSSYSFNNWPADENGNQQTYQVTIRFCNPGDDATCKKNFPKESWVKDNWDSYSTIYHCISGSCRSDQNKPKDYPGFCIELYKCNERDGSSVMNLADSLIEKILLGSGRFSQEQINNLKNQEQAQKISLQRIMY
jgi:type II secretory pathway pseudopilin PulG